MAIQLRAATNPSIQATASLVVNKPTGTLEGDLMIMACMTSGGRPSFAIPDGWAEIPNSWAGTGSPPRMILLYKVATGSEPSSYTLVYPEADAVAAGIASFYSDEALPLRLNNDVATFAEDPGSAAESFERFWPAIELEASGLICCFGCFGANAGSTPSTGMSEVWDTGSTRQYLMTGPVSGPGTSPAPSATTIVKTDYTNITIAILEDQGEQEPFPGPRFRSQASTGGTSTSSAFSLTLPTDMAAGDLLLLHFSLGDPRTPSVPSDWTELADVTISGDEGLWAYWKIAEAGDVGGSVTVTLSEDAQYAVGVTVWHSPTGKTLTVESAASQTLEISATFTYPEAETAAANAGVDYLTTASNNTNFQVDGGAVNRYRASPGSQFAINSATDVVEGPGTISGFTNAPSAAFTSAHTATIVIVEQEEEEGGLSASITRWLRVHGARQDTFGTAAAPVFSLPVSAEYQQGDIEHIAEWDRGLWTPAEIVELVAEFATFTLRGVLFYELLPVLFSAGFDAMTPTGSGPYSYSGSAGQSAVGEPAAYTFRLGGDEGSVGSMVQVQDAYLESLLLTFNLNNKAVLFESRWFGRRIDDNDGAGYAPSSVPLPDGLKMANGLLSTIGIQDAGATGGAFDDLADFECSVIEWQLQIDTGLRPQWAADQNGLTYCGVRHEEPKAVWMPQIRTTADNYAVTLTKAQARTYQELQLALAATDRELTLQMTGRWLGKLNAHNRSRDEVVMQPTFQVATPRTQTTTPHWMSWEIEAGWQHPAQEQAWNLSGVVAAYEPINAASLAESYVNLANPGVNDAAPGVAPTFAAGVGWTFDGLTQYLTTGLAPAVGYSMVVRFTGVSGNEAYACGSSDTGANFFTLAPRTSLATFHNYGYTSGIAVVPALSDGVMAIAAENCYLNGEADGSTTPGTITSQPIFIGARNNGGTPLGFMAGTITHLYIYNRQLTDDEVEAITEAIASVTPR